MFVYVERTVQLTRCTTKPDWQ